MSRTAWIWTAVIVVVVAAGVYWYMQKPVADQSSSVVTGDQTGMVSGDQAAPGPETVPSGTSTGSLDAGVDVGVGTPKTVTVNYDGSKFSPASVTIAKGDTVKFLAASGKTMWVASDEHPTHTEFDSTSRSQHCAAGYTGAKPFDQCSGGTSYSFTFTKAGSFDYHDHMNASAGGKVVVQ